MRLKVANIIEEGRYGGPQGRIASVAAQLNELAVETTVVCPVQDSGVFIKELKAKGVRHLVIRMHRLTAQPSHLIGFILSFTPEVIRLARLLRKRSHCT